MAEEKKDTMTPETEECAAPENKKEKKCDSKKHKAELEDMKKKLEEAEALAAEANDKYLRLVAEFDNFKKKTQKEKDEIYSIAKTDVVLGLLPIIDNFERAEKFSDDKNIEEGMALVKKQFMEFLKKIGVEDRFGQSGKPDALLEEYGLSTEQVLAKIKAIL